MEKELNFNEFLKQQYSDWVKEAELSLKGKPLSSLETQTYESFKLKPLYVEEDLESLKYLDYSYPGFEYFLRGTELLGYKNRKWLNIVDISNVEPATLKNFLSKENELCPDGVSYHFDFAEKDSFVEHIILTKEDLKDYFENLDFKNSHFYFGANSNPLLIFNIIDSFFDEISVNPSELKGGFEFSPVNYWLKSGKIEKDTTTVFDEMTELINNVSKKYPNFKTIAIDSTLFHNAGANAIQELAFTLAIGNLYILEMLERGLNIDEIASKIRVTMSVGSQFFGEIAKFRAIRVLWANLIKAYGGNSIAQKLNLNVVTTLINKSKLDPYVNILRITSETISAIIGGCDSIQTHSFEHIYKKADDFSLRLAVNTQNVLREECNLLDVIDPSAGSYLIENLTKTYCEEAWKLFGEISEKGSFIDNLKSGLIQDLINQIYEAKHKNMLIRKDVLIGTNKYPNLKEDNGINYRNEEKNIDSNLSKSNSELISIIQKKIEETEFIEIPKLNQKRLSEPFEELRLRSENFKNSTGNYPKVLLACFGSLKQYKPRADFSSEYFAVGGFESELYTFDNIESALTEISKSDIKVCVICSSDDLYETLVEDFARKFKNQNTNKILILAGNPGEKQAQFSSAGVDDYIYLRSNVYEKLNLIMNKIGI
ncbi:MAG: acyl-CoA mutase large subunit family protein [Candidatus Kapabacteria bacterium]|nr:acyl-CoA mutase large subunit family protein [Candidatus Kapabacteria bacterium]